MAHDELRIKSMGSDQEINAAVARKLGYCTENHNQLSCKKTYWSPRLGPDFCHDIKAAFEIKNIESLIRLKDGRWSARFGDGATDGSYYEVGIYSDYDYLEMAIADSAPMAICLAFLKLQ